MQLGPRTWFLAVTRGFGAVDGVAIERALLSRLRAECEKRLRSERFRRAVDRPHAAATAVLAALARVNSELFARTAGHEDYVTAAASLTAALVVRGRAYVMHAGGTAAYLAHRGEIVALSGDDTFDDAPMPLLARALGTTPTLDVAVSSVMLDEGDVIILVGRRVPGDVDRRALIAHVESSNPAEHLLVARFERDDATETNEKPQRTYRPMQAVAAVVRIAAAIGLIFAMVFAR
jgi:serine/threonine protein phosphatase PrpC